MLTRSTTQNNFILNLVKGNFLLENQNHESTRKKTDRHGQKAFAAIRRDKKKPKTFLRLRLYRDSVIFVDYSTHSFVGLPSQGFVHPVVPGL